MALSLSTPRLALLLFLSFGLGGATGALGACRARPQTQASCAPEAEPVADLPQRVSIPPEQVGKLMLFVLAGQSNMSGRAPLPPSRPMPRSSINVYGNDGHWHEGREPVDFAEGQVDGVSADPGAGFGPSIAFAEALSDRRPSIAIGLIPCAKGGTALAEWAPSHSPDTLYGACLARALAASAVGTIAGVLFFQGEADASDPKYGIGIPLHSDTWNEEFDKYVASMRKDLNNGRLPIVFAEIGKNPNMERFSRWENVKASQRKVSLPLVSRIQTDDLALWDALHFTAPSYVVIGQRFALAMDALLGPAGAERFEK